MLNALNIPVGVVAFDCAAFSLVCCKLWRKWQEMLYWLILIFRVKEREQTNIIHPTLIQLSIGVLTHTMVSTLCENAVARLIRGLL